MKHAYLFVLFICLLSSMFAQEKANSEPDFYPNTLIVCFDAEAIKTTTGDIKVDKTRSNQIQIGLPSFDKIARDYDFTDIQRMFWVKNQQWKDENGAYPMNIFKITIKDDTQKDNALKALLSLVCKDGINADALSDGINAVPTGSVDTPLIFAELEAVLRTSYTPNDPLFIQQYYHQLISSPQMWDHIRDASEVIVAIVDSGVKWNHVDLGSNIYINEAELPGIVLDRVNGTISGGDGIDNDGNGYIDDVIGWDFTSLPGTNNSFQAYSNDNGKNDHGTHMAGLVGGKGDNFIGITGMAMNVKLLITKHTPHNILSNNIYNAYNGIYYAADTGAHVINCSWGGQGSANTANNAVNYATNAGALVVTSAGNYNLNLDITSLFPACSPNALTVGATNHNDQKSYFSCYGHDIDVMAPGTAIYSLTYDGSGALATDEYTLYDGSSMSAAIVSGLAAMVKAAHPEMTPLQIKQTIIGSCDQLIQNTQGEYAGLLGNGRINASRAVTLDTTTIAMPPRIQMSYSSPAQVTLLWNPANSSDPIGYKVYRDGTLLTNTPVTATRYTDNTVSADSEYTYSVTAIYSGDIESVPNFTVVNTVTGIAQLGSGSLINQLYNAHLEPGPICGDHFNMRGQFVITAEELAMAGIVGETAIAQIGFFVHSGLEDGVFNWDDYVFPLPSFTFRLKHTTAIDASAEDNGPYSVTTIMPSVWYLVLDFWNMVTLDTPFYWNGVDNILIDTVFGHIPSGAGPSGANRMIPAVNGFRYGYGSTFGSIYSITTTNPSTSGIMDYKPQIRINYSSGNICNPPRNLTATPGDGQISLTWDPPNPGNTGTVSGYIVTISGGLTTNRSGIIPANTPFFVDTVSNGQSSIFGDTAQLYTYAVHAIYENPAGVSLASNIETASPRSTHALVNVDWESSASHDSEVYTPFNYNRNASLTQTVYLQSEISIRDTPEINAFGTIETIMFKINGNPDTPADIPVSIWMTTTTQTGFPYQNPTWIDPSLFTLVYSGNLPGHYPRWTTTEIAITLDTPFLYQGGNLVVMCHKGYTENTYSGNYWTVGSRYSPNYPTLYYYSTTDFDPLTNLPTGTRESNRPVTRLVINTSAVARLKGRVTSAGQPLANVTVAIAGSNISTTTDTEGGYYIDSINPGAKTLTFSKDTYQTQNVSVNLVANLQTVQNVSMVQRLRDICAESITTSTWCKVLEPIDITVRIRNTAAMTVSVGDYSLELRETGNSSPLATLPGVTLVTDDQHDFILTYTPPTAGIYEIYGIAVFTSDENQANNSTTTTTITVEPENNNVVYIGNRSSAVSNASLLGNNEYPIGLGHLSQTIYPAGDISSQGVITKIVYPHTYTSSYPQYIPHISVYMAITNLSDFATNSSWIPAEQFTLVYQGNPISNTSAYPQDIPIELTTPYAYTGGNLVIMVHTSSIVGFFHTLHTEVGQNRMLYHTGRSPANLGTGSLSSSFPNATIIIDTAEYGNISGVVTLEGDPVENAQIGISGQARKVFTDASGAFIFSNVPAGTVTVDATWFGYQYINNAVIITQNQTLSLEMELTLPQGVVYRYHGDIDSTDRSQQFPFMYTSPNTYTDSKGFAQTIYLADELNISGVITAVIYRFTSANNITQDVTVSLYMANTTQSEFSTTTDLIPYNAFTPVYTGTLPVKSTGTYDIRIDLDSPFYSNGENLVLMTYKHNSQRYTNNFWQTTTQASNRTLYYTNAIPQSNVTGTGTLSPQTPNVTLLYDVSNMGHLVGTAMYQGEPLSDVQISIDGTIRTATTNAQGFFDIPYLPAGTVNFTATREYFQTYNGTLTITPTETSVADFVMILISPYLLSAEIIENHIVLNWSGYTQAPVAQTVAMGVSAKTPIDTKNGATYPDNHHYRNFAGYVVYRNEQELTQQSETTFTDRTAFNDTPYTYYIKAIHTDPDWETDPSNTVSVILRNPPTDLAATVSFGLVNLVWQAPSAGGDGNPPTTEMDDGNRPATVIPSVSKTTRTTLMSSQQTDDTVKSTRHHTRSLSGYRIYRNGELLPVIVSDLSFTDDYSTGLQDGYFYTYYVTAVYTDPVGESEGSNQVSARPLSDNDTVIVTKTDLRGNYPNPFNPTTTIAFDIAQPGHVTLKIYNTKGQLVKTLVNGACDVGNHQVIWDGHDNIGATVGSGIYFYRMVAGDFISVKKMLLIK